MRGVSVLLCVVAVSARISVQENRSLSGNYRLKLLEHSLNNWAAKVKERNAFLLARSYAKHRMAMRAKSGHGYFGPLFFQPTFECPVPLVKTTSVATQWDGGKWMCGLDNIAPPCALLSLGSNGDASFEEFVQRRIASRHGAGCTVQIFDPTIAPPGVPADAARAFSAGLSPTWKLIETVNPGVPEAALTAIGKRFQSRRGAVRSGPAVAGLTRLGTLKLIAVSGEGGEAGNRSVKLGAQLYPAMTLREIVTGMAVRCVDVVKIDVEGSEWDILHTVDWSNVCAGILLFEQHSNPKFLPARHGDYISVGTQLDYHRKLENAGFRHYMSEAVCPANECTGLQEQGWVNVTWLRERL